MAIFENSKPEKTKGKALGSHADGCKCNRPDKSPTLTPSSLSLAGISGRTSMTPF